MLYSLHNGIALLHKYTSTDRQGVGQTPVSRSNSRVWCASPVVWGAFRSAVFWSARLGRMLPQHWRFPPASGAVPQAFTPLWGGYCLAREVPLLRGMPTEPRVFLIMPDASRLRPYDRTHLKNGLVPYSLVQ